MSDTTTDAEALQRIADFDHPFRVTNRPASDEELAASRAYRETTAHVVWNADNEPVVASLSDDNLTGIYAPEVMHADMPGCELDGLGQWEALTGYTGQYGYDGPVMHASETLSGGLAADVLATPGIYVVVAVECYPESLWPHDWSESGARCTRTGCNTAGTGDPDDNPCTQHPEYDAEADENGEGWEYPEPAGWAILRLGHVNYPHWPGRLYDCKACEAQCHCDPDPGTTACVFEGPHLYGKGSDQ